MCASLGRQQADLAHLLGDLQRLVVFSFFPGRGADLKLLAVAHTVKHGRQR
jgi:hypothetical protein